MSENLSSMNNIPILIDVQSIPRLSLYIDFKYANEKQNSRVDVSVGNKYELIYIENRELVKVTGIVRSIQKIYNYQAQVAYSADMYMGYNSASKPDAEYILTIDCSTDYESNVVKLKTSAIRFMKEYLKYSDDPTETTKTISNGGITYGVVKNCTIENVSINGNKIVAGTVKKTIPWTPLTPAHKIEQPKPTTPPENTNPEAKPVKTIPWTPLTPAKKIEQPKPKIPISDPSSLMPSGSAIDGVNGPATNHYEGAAAIPLPQKPLYKNVTDGNITAGYVDGYTVQGATAGINKMGHKITLVDAKVRNGKLTGGIVIAGTFDPTKAKLEGTTITGEIDNIIVVNSMIEDATSEGGTIIDPTMDTATVSGDLLITGPEMVTTSGVTLDDITYGGVTKNGIIKNGVATGIVAGRPATLTGDITTTGAIVKGAVIKGGKCVGGNIISNTIINGSIEGGIGSGGVATGGKTTGGILTFNYHGIPVVQQTDAKGDNTVPDDSTHGLVVSNDHIHGIQSNLGDGNITPPVSDGMPIPNAVPQYPIPTPPSELNPVGKEFIGVISTYGIHDTDLNGTMLVLSKDAKLPGPIETITGSIDVDTSSVVIAPHTPDKPTVGTVNMNDIAGTVEVTE